MLGASVMFVVLDQRDLFLNTFFIVAVFQPIANSGVLAHEDVTQGRDRHLTKLKIKTTRVNLPFWAKYICHLNHKTRKLDCVAIQVLETSKA